MSKVFEEEREGLGKRETFFRKFPSSPNLFPPSPSYSYKLSPVRMRMP